MGQSIVQVDAFTDRAFAGNPAAVCIMEEAADERWMQAVAREMNLAETAFLHPAGDGYRLRWFTPAVEVDLCGHATLASAHVLWEEGTLPRATQAQFHSRSGVLTAVSRGDWIELDFPSTPPEPSEVPDGLESILGVNPRFVGRSRFDLFVELPSENDLRALEPDIARLRNLRARGLIVTARAEEGPFDFVSRFFAPAVGVDEDPVTGSAHCALAPYWSHRLGKTEMVGYQASARGGVVRVRADGPRVRLAGQAVTVLRGELTPAALGRDS
jgi:PhzF family phenazine biosynthesis protein